MFWSLTMFCFILKMTWECSGRTKTRGDCRAERASSRGQIFFRLTLAGGWDLHNQLERLPETKQEYTYEQMHICVGIVTSMHFRGNIGKRFLDYNEFLKNYKYSISKGHTEFLHIVMPGNVVLPVWVAVTQNIVMCQPHTHKKNNQCKVAVWFHKYTSCTNSIKNFKI